jgi:hypothetical protein
MTGMPPHSRHLLNQYHQKERPPMRHFLQHTALQPGRRSFLLGTAGTLAGGLAASLSRPGISEAHFDFRHPSQHNAEPLPAPKPILGGFNAPPLIHEFLPGPEDITLPFTLITLQGLHVEPSTITDFKGVTALAYHVGTATGNDGLTYNLETDIRVIDGEYVAEDGSQHKGTFAEM